MFGANKRLWMIVAAVLAFAVIGGGTGAGIVVATGGDDDQPITGRALEECTQAALAEHPDGRVTETEVGDEESYYEVEVTLADGRQVDVQLDKNCEVIGQQTDDGDGPNDG